MQQHRRVYTSLLCLICAATVLSPSLLFGSIEEQRARLPPAAIVDAGADCSDPVVGLWLGQQYNPRSRSWQRYQLDVRRTAPGSSTLIGEVRVHFWIGWRSHSEPRTDCSHNALAAEVSQRAAGVIDGLSLTFGGLDWRTTQVFCQPLGTSVSYNPDRFTGVIDPSIQEFQSVNNDGGTAINEPVVFRRIRCAESPRAQVIIVPPTGALDAPNASRRRSLFRCSR
jgi:hypothetical protein